MRVWIDIENAPQAWFFRPLLPALRARGAETLITVRDYGEAVALLEAASERFTVVGGVAGGSRLARTAAVATRALALARFARGRGVDVAVSHGVRPHLAAAALLRIPCLTGYDYEHASKLLVHRLACEVLVPRVLLEQYLRPVGADLTKVTPYDGFKEELYLTDFSPDNAIYAALTLDPTRPIVTIRPPSFHAHYASDEGNALFFDVLVTLRRNPETQLVITARDATQRAQIASVCGGDPSVRTPERPVDGLNLIWHSDLVISGGGTMAREAALLGVPAISIFRGTPGVLDAHLESLGRLRRIRAASELNSTPIVAARAQRTLPPRRSDLVEVVVARILSHA
ncbi:MAG: DUF354 domain-containing protein [Deltaproteobacteria bacterium]|nr:DUF354 domain-containing protein [Deltaproteobacteria bacterium]MBI3390247.1 DUF354 domain-containing protein [Deltaproteobacteria bacterium]